MVNQKARDLVENGLYVVATPIGNLGDITYRAVEILKRSHFVLAEDTRQSKKLLDRYGITTQLVSYRDENHERIISKVIEKLDAGLILSLVSDSGTPTISDPGFKLVRELAQRGYKIFAVPGASAVIAALSISGLPTDKFVFLGFLPKADSTRKAILHCYCELDNTVVIYESPHRLKSLLGLLNSLYSKRTVAICSDLTKLYEECWRGTVAEAIAKFELREIKGEVVVIVAKEEFNLQK